MAAHIAEELKETGNCFYQQHRYEDAINAYSRAIINNPVIPTYFTNRALCYMQTMQWERAEDDCKKALDLDRKNVKANFFLGRTCVQLGHFDEALKVLTRANDLAHSQKLNFGDEITAQIRIVKKEIFRREEEKRIKQEIELQTYLNGLIDSDLEGKLQKLKEKKENSKNSEAITNDLDLNNEEMALKMEAQSSKDKLNNLFAQVDEKRRKREVPDYLCGKISFEMLRDPVITPSGITYDRADIKEHLQRVGHFDPVTRAPLTVDQLIPNLAMKENGWHWVFSAVSRVVLDPNLTQETREKLVKLLRQFAENAWVTIRNIRRDIIEGIEKMQESKEISGDDFHSAKKEMQNITDDNIKKIDSELSIYFDNCSQLVVFNFR